MADHAKLIGVLTDRDIVVNVVADGRDPKQTPVTDVMTRDPIACRAEESADIAMELMALRQIRRVPIVGDEGEVIGIIAQADVATRLADAEQTGHVVEAISEPTVDTTRQHQYTRLQTHTPAFRLQLSADTLVS